MKNSNLLKLPLLVILFIAFGFSVQAKNIYLSLNGKDTNTGLDENNPVATLTKAFSLSAEDDVIFVSGIIDLSKELTGSTGFVIPDMNITIDGKDKSTSGFTGNNKTRIFSVNNNTKTPIIKNVTLSNGTSSEGGAIYLLNCKNFTLENSVVENCSARDGGAIYITEDETVENLKSNILIESCLISNNTAEVGGAAISIYNQIEGNNYNLIIVNSTIYSNESGMMAENGAIAFHGAQIGSMVNFTNCTIVKNKIGTIDPPLGAGISFLIGTDRLVKKIYNCIIESNTDQKSGQKSDIAFRVLPEDGKDLFLYNSYIGGIFVRNATYESIPQNNNRIDYLLSELAELATPYDDYIASQNSIPLEYNASAIYHGNPQYLKDLGISTDQNGNERKFENNQCAVGAVEKPASRPIGIEPQVFQQFIMYGQSLSTGHEAYPVSTENIEGNYMIGDQIWINYGNTNLDQLNPLRAAKAKGLFELSEAPLHGMVNHLRLQQQAHFPEIENKFIATSAGTSGALIEELSKGSKNNLYADFQNAIRYGKRVVTKLNSEITVPAIFWLQGEFNYEGANRATTKDAYKKLMIQLKNDMQGEIQDRYLQEEKPLFITYQVGAQYTRGMQVAIGMAQLEASNEYREVICAGPIYPMTDFGGHLDGNGYRWYGEMLGKAYYKTKMLGEDFKPLQPSKLEKDSNDLKKVYVTFRVPVSPLVLDTSILKKQNNYGFNLYLRGNSQKISNVEIINDSIVAITSATDLASGKIAISYAGQPTNGHGNLRDSDPWEAFFTYENPDGKSEDGQFPDKNDPEGMNFIFDHFYDPENERVNEGPWAEWAPWGKRYRATLIPVSGEPLGEDGNPIYGQPYPLYNFSVAFYYEIADGENSFVVPNLDGNYPPDDDTAIPTINNNNDISIYQAGKSVYITLPESGNVSMELFDISGKKIKQFEGNYQFSQERKEYPLYSIPSGVYIVKVTTPNKIQSSKVIL